METRETQARARCQGRVAPGLRDLVETGVLEHKAGNQEHIYVVAESSVGDSKVEQIDALILIALQDFEATVDDLAEVLGASHDRITPRLTALAADCRINQVVLGGEVRYRKEREARKLEVLRRCYCPACFVSYSCQFL